MIPLSIHSKNSCVKMTNIVKNTDSNTYRVVLKITYVITEYFYMCKYSTY